MRRFHLSETKDFPQLAQTVLTLWLKSRLSKERIAKDKELKEHVFGLLFWTSENILCIDESQSLLKTGWSNTMFVHLFLVSVSGQSVEKVISFWLDKNIVVCKPVHRNITVWWLNVNHNFIRKTSLLARHQPVFCMTISWFTFQFRTTTKLLRAWFMDSNASRDQCFSDFVQIHFYTWKQRFYYHFKKQHHGSLSNIKQLLPKMYPKRTFVYFRKTRGTRIFCGKTVDLQAQNTRYE